MERYAGGVMSREQAVLIFLCIVLSLLFHNRGFKEAKEQQAEQFKQDLKETNNFIEQGIGERLKMIGRKEYLEGRL